MIDLDKLRQLYKFGKEITLQDAQLLIKEAKSKRFGKRELLIDEGTIRKEVFYIRKGLVRCFHINQKGEEITFRLIPEHQVVVNVDILLFNQASRFFYEALEETSTYSMSYDTLQSIVSKDLKFESGRKLLYQAMIKQAHSRIESFVLYSPEERYLKYIREYPNLTNRVPDKYLAHVLGITPVSLSRIRKRISSKK